MCGTARINIPMKQGEGKEIKSDLTREESKAFNASLSSQDIYSSLVKELLSQYENYKYNILCKKLVL